MRNFWIIITLIVFGQTKIICQNDSTLTFKLEITNPHGLQKEIYLNPKKKIHIYKRDRHIICLTNDYSINENSILYNSETIMFNNIRKINGYKMQRSDKKVARTVFFITGGTLMLFALIGRGIHPYGGSSDLSGLASYERFIQKYKYMAIIGATFTIGGIALLDYNKTYYLDKGWRLKKGYYSDLNENKN